jgi:hypothetical protein
MNIKCVIIKLSYTLLYSYNFLNYEKNGFLMILLLIPNKMSLKKGQREKYENGYSFYGIISHNLAHSYLKTLFQGKLRFDDAEMSI